MKRLITILSLFVFFNLSFGQTTYTVNNETLQLTLEIVGELDLLWTVKDKTYRYFVRTADGNITELKNSKDVYGNYQEEYKDVLQAATNTDVDTQNVSLTKGGLRRFFVAYNKKVNPNFKADNGNKEINFRLSFLGGITNHPLVQNIKNTTNLVLASELELYGDTYNPRHSGLLQARQTFASDGKYSSTEFTLGYRLRIIKNDNFNLFVQNRFASLTSFKVDVPVTIDNMTTIESRNDTEFEIPLMFGIGADFKVGNNSYITVLYDRFYAVGLDNRNDFPMDIMVGYRFKL